MHPHPVPPLILGLVTLCVGISPPARGCGSGPCLPSPSSARETTSLGEPTLVDLRQLPADVDVAICVSNLGWASRQTSGKAGRELAEELATSLGLPSAWNELWNRLDYQSDEAVDQLLGRRVVVAWRATSPAVADAAGRVQSLDWVLLSLVPAEAERRIRERLRPAPRDVEAGQAILALEDGRYLLTTRRLGGPSGRAAGRGDQWAIIMLAPSNAMSLFKQMLPRLAEVGPAPPASLGDDPVVRSLAPLLTADIAMIARGRALEDPRTPTRPTGPASDPAHTPTQDVAILGASWRRGDALEASGPGLSARIVRVGPSIPTRFPSGGALPLQELERLSDAALLAVSDVLPPEQPDDDPGAERTPAIRLLAPPGLSVSETITAILDLMALPQPARHALGPGALLMVGGAGRNDDPFWFSLGVQVQDISAVAPEADAATSLVLATDHDDHAGPNFAGMYPAAVRCADVEPGSPLSLSALLGPSARLVWHFPPRDQPAELAAIGATPDLTPPRPYWQRPGWWIARLGSPGTTDPAAALRDASSILTSAPSDDRAAIAGVVRPANLLAAMASIGLPFPPTLKVLRWMPRIAWEGRLTASDRLEIDLDIDLTPTMGRRP